MHRESKFGPLGCLQLRGHMGGSNLGLQCILGWMVNLTNLNTYEGTQPKHMSLLKQINTLQSVKLHHHWLSFICHFMLYTYLEPTHVGKEPLHACLLREELVLYPSIWNAIVASGIELLNHLVMESSSRTTFLRIKAHYNPFHAK